MLDYLDTLRKKPLAVRKRYTLGITVAIMVVISGVYGTLLIYNNSTSDSDVVAATEPSSDPSPFQALFGAVGSQYAQVMDSISASNPLKDHSNDTPDITADTTVSASDTPTVATSTHASTTASSTPQKPSFNEVIITDSPSR